MTEVSQYHGKLISTTDDSSTPSNNSEYFSVTSSLDILNCSDEVYYSMDEEIEREVHENDFIIHMKNISHETIKESNRELKNIMEARLLNVNEMIPEISVNEHFVNDDDWDKVCDISVISQESVSTDEEENNNGSNLTECNDNHCCTERHDSDNDDNALISVNNNTQMTNSIIEGELSEINDIIYESSLSQDPCVNEEDENYKAEITEEIHELELSILEMVRKIEFSELEYNEINQESDNLEKENNNIMQKHEAVESTQLMSSASLDKGSNISPEKKVQNLEDVNIISKLKKESSLSKRNETSEDSSLKTSALCCSIKRKKDKSNLPKSKPSKSKSLFSCLRFRKKENLELSSVKSLPQLNSYEKEGTHVLILENDDYQFIPFIDADVGVYSDTYIPLAKHELFSE